VFVEWFVFAFILPCVCVLAFTISSVRALCSPSPSQPVL
jgi:hypothetical protein